MSDDISTYTFDFSQEVSALQESLGALCDRFIFLESEVNAGEVDFQHAMGREAVVKDYLLSVEEAVTGLYQESPGHGSHTFAFASEGVYQGTVISIRSNESMINALGPDNLPLMRLFSLYHETGHALLGISDNEDGGARLECEADAYAAMKILQRFGAAVIPFLSQVSWSRAFRAAASDMEHLSTVVLDKIIADSREQNFTAFSNEEMMSRARGYARDWGADGATLAAAQPVLVPKEESIDFYALAERTLTSSNVLAFYAGAKVLQPFLTPQGLEMNGREQHMPEDVQKQIAAAIEKRFKGETLESIFNKAAVSGKTEADVLSSLKTDIPNGQKRLVYKA